VRACPAYHSRDVMRSAAGALLAAALVAAVSVGHTAQGATRAADRVSLSGSQCTAQEVRSVVVSFIVNFNDGDLRQVNRLFSPAGLFKWYSVSGPAGRLQDASLDRATLIAYLASRHREGERLTLRSFQLERLCPWVRPVPVFPHSKRTRPASDELLGEGSGAAPPPADDLGLVDRAAVGTADSPARACGMTARNACAR
jgi:hypothetical protein